MGIGMVLRYLLTVLYKVLLNSMAAVNETELLQIVTTTYLSVSDIKLGLFHVVEISLRSISSVSFWIDRLLHLFSTNLDGSNKIETDSRVYINSPIPIVQIVQCRESILFESYSYELRILVKCISHLVRTQRQDLKLRVSCRPKHSRDAVLRKLYANIW